MSLRGKVVAITGASSGIGQATAELLAAAGANVVLGARRADRLKAVAEGIREKGGEVAWRVVDVVKRADNDDLVALAEAKFGRLDVFIANAGVMLLAPVENADPNEWDRMWDVNLRGLVNGVAAALPAMRRAGKGHVVTIASVAGLKALPGCAVYCATKFGVRAFSESLRQEVGSDIRVTIVNPGAIDTELPSHVTDETVMRSLESAYAVALPPTAVAAAIGYALMQAPEVDVNEITVRPAAQDI